MIIRLLMIVLLLVSIISGCRKTNYVHTIATPVSYYSTKINGAHTWSGTYYSANNNPRDTNLRFNIKTLSDSIILVSLPNSTDKVFYRMTDEVAETLFYNGGGSLNNYYHDVYLIYHYGSGLFEYKNENYYVPYAYHYTFISGLVLHSP